MTDLLILDASTLRGLRELGGDEPQALLDELFVLMFATAHEQLAEMRRAADTGNLDTVRRAAHTLKGGAGSIGAQEVAFLAGLIEAQARAGAKADWHELANSLEEAVNRLRETAGNLGMKTAA